MKKIKKLISLLIVCSLSCVLLLSGCSGRNINLDKYTTVSFEGYDGYGKAIVDFDYDAFEEDYGSKLKIDTSSSMAVWYEGMSIGDIIADFVYTSVSPNSGLSNGDTVEETWEVEEAYIKELLGCSVSYSDSTLTVEGLEEVSEADVFDGVSVTFSGNDGYGTANVIADNQFKSSGSSSFSFGVKPNTGLSNGDTVTLYISMNDRDEFISEFGVVPATMETEVTVEGLEELKNIDVFDGVSVDFAGVSPDGSASVIVDNKFYEDGYFPSRTYELDQTEGLATGDIVTVTFSVDDVEAFIDEFGGVPETYEKQFEVSGLDSYVTDISQLTDANIAKLEKEAVDQVEATANSINGIAAEKIFDVYSSFDVSSFKVGDDCTLNYVYAYTDKDLVPSWDEPTYSIKFVYSISMTYYYYDNNSETKTLYYAVSYNDLIQESNANLVGTSDVKISSEYTDFDALYKDYVTTQKDEYNIKIYDSNLNETSTENK